MKYSRKKLSCLVLLAATLLLSWFSPSKVPKDLRDALNPSEETSFFQDLSSVRDLTVSGSKRFAEKTIGKPAGISKLPSANPDFSRLSEAQKAVLEDAERHARLMSEKAHSALLSLFHKEGLVEVQRLVEFLVV